MSGKLKWIVLIAVAGLSFGASFFLSSRGRATSRPAARPPVVAEKPADDAAGGDDGEPAAVGRERQLDDLIKQVRAKLDDCRARDKALDEREKRLTMAQELLKKDAQDLESLRLQLVGPLASLAKARKDLDDSRIQISLQERANLKKQAAIYEKMDSASGSRILQEMCTGRNDDDAARLLHYMSERAAAKLLGEMTDKGAAARLSEKMKRVQEKG